MTPKEKVIPSAIKWMTKLAATMTHPQPYKEIEMRRVYSTYYFILAHCVFSPTNLHRVPSWRHPHPHLPVRLGRFHWRSKKSLLLAKKQIIIIDSLSLSFSIWNSLKNIKLVCQSSMSNHWQHFMNRRNAGEPRMSIQIFFVHANFVVPSQIELNSFIASPVEIAYNVSPLFCWSVGKSIKRYSVRTAEFELNGIVWKQKNENKRARDVLAGSPWQQQGVRAKKPETDPEPP